MGNTISQGPQEVQGMREQISLMLQKNTIMEAPPDSLFKRFKQLIAHIFSPHFHMCAITSVLSTIGKGYYVFKIDLQDAYFHVPIHPDSRMYTFCLSIQGISVPGTFLRSEH